MSNDFLPMPRHDDPDLPKYDLTGIIQINFILAKFELIELKRKNRRLKKALVALAIALALVMGAVGGAIYAGMPDQVGLQKWQIKVSGRVAHKWQERL